MVRDAFSAQKSHDGVREAGKFGDVAGERRFESFTIFVFCGLLVPRDLASRGVGVCTHICMHVEVRISGSRSDVGERKLVRRAFSEVTSAI